VESRREGNAGHHPARVPIRRGESRAQDSGNASKDLQRARSPMSTRATATVAGRVVGSTPPPPSVQERHGGRWTSRSKGPSAKGSRPGLKLEGTVEPRSGLADVRKVGRPRAARDTAPSVFSNCRRMASACALQVQVDARSSTNEVENSSRGLSAGDQVILSDMSN